VDQYAVRAGAVGRAVAPVEFEKLFGDDAERAFELAAVIAAKLDGEMCGIGDHSSLRRVRKYGNGRDDYESNPQ
jgi:hypothetical protein